MLSICTEHTWICKYNTSTVNSSASSRKWCTLVQGGPPARFRGGQLHPPPQPRGSLMRTLEENADVPQKVMNKPKVGYSTRCADTSSAHNHYIADRWRNKISRQIVQWVVCLSTLGSNWSHSGGLCSVIRKKLPLSLQVRHLVRPGPTKYHFRIQTYKHST